MNQKPLLNNNLGVTAPDYRDAEKIFSARCEFMRGVKDVKSLQQLSMPEIAFGGRSNVGKSSLLNALIAQKDMARVSKTPGRTKELNFFNLGDRLILVDMPGYGYAKVPESERRSWDAFLPQYLSQRDRLKRVFLLIDGRHGIKDNDQGMMHLLEQTETPYQLVFTKIDQIKYEQIGALYADSEQHIPKAGYGVQTPILVSSKTREGVAELQAVIAGLVRSARE